MSFRPHNAMLNFKTALVVVSNLVVTTSLLPTGHLWRHSLPGGGRRCLWRPLAVLSWRPGRGQHHHLGQVHPCAESDPAAQRGAPYRRRREWRRGGPRWRREGSQWRGPCGGGTGRWCTCTVSNLRPVPETLYHRDDALTYIAYVMLIWAAPIPADRWHCSLWPYLTHWVDWHAPLVAEISCALIVH